MVYWDLMAPLKLQFNVKIYTFDEFYNTLLFKVTCLKSSSMSVNIHINIQHAKGLQL